MIINLVEESPLEETASDLAQLFCFLLVADKGAEFSVGIQALSPALVGFGVVNFLANHFCLIFDILTMVQVPFFIVFMACL